MMRTAYEIRNLKPADRPYNRTAGSRGLAASLPAQTDLPGPGWSNQERHQTVTDPLNQCQPIRNAALQLTYSERSGKFGGVNC